MEGADTKDHLAAAELIWRHRYRKEYGLTAAEMDAEPYGEFLRVRAIWRAEMKKERLDQLRAEQARQQP